MGQTRIEKKMVFTIFIMTTIILESSTAFPQTINNDDYYDGGNFLCSSEKEAGYR